MHNVGFALEGAWQVLVVGLVLGAGLPAVFALGIRAMAHGSGAPVSGVGRVLGVVCFAVVVLGALTGIAYIVASGLGMELSFGHGYPTIEEKS